MAYVSNTQVVKASKLVESIDLGPTKEYNSTQIFVDSDDLNNFKDDTQAKLTLTI